MLAIVVLGGMGSQLGVAIAALAMIGGFELFRGLEQYRMLVFGLAMVLIMIWRPRGLVGHRAPSVFLEQNQAISSASSRRGTDERRPILSVDHLTMRFGGLVAVNDLSFAADAAQDHRADRAERRRQDHRVQLHHRLLQAHSAAHAADA